LKPFNIPWEYIHICTTYIHVFQNHASHNIHPNRCLKLAFVLAVQVSKFEPQDLSLLPALPYVLSQMLVNVRDKISCYSPFDSFGSFFQLTRSCSITSILHELWLA
jgi:hypothetical protein